MPLPDKWASPEDFATLFQYFWHRDFPIGQGATGAQRADWTIHIGIVVRNIGDLVGLRTRFERGGRKDAILRSAEGDEIAVEWEWDGVQGNELDKLRKHKVWSSRAEGERSLNYGVLITYTHTSNVEDAWREVATRWRGARWPLLVILIDREDSERFQIGKEFKMIRASLFDSEGSHRDLREAPALPWNVAASRWELDMLGQDPESIRDLLKRLNPH